MKKIKKHVPKEATIRSGIMRKLKKYAPDGYARGLPGGQYARGLPDILFVYKGIPVMIEVKRPGGVPTRLQALELSAFERAGAVSLVMDGVDQVEKLITNLNDIVYLRDIADRITAPTWQNYWK